MRSLWRRRSLAVGYWHYWLRSVDQNSLHAPFLDQFYRVVIAPTNHASALSGIEQYRNSLKKSKRRVKISSIGAPSSVSRSSWRTVGSIARSSLSSPKFGHLLYRLAQFQPAETVIELGTSLGVTTLYLAKAAPNSQVYTLEGNESIADVAQRTFEEFDCQNIDLRVGNIDNTLPHLLKEIDRVALVYVDANHRFEPTMSYFYQLLDKVHEESILVFDDIHWSFEMRKAWSSIRTHARVTLSIDLFDAGIVFFRPNIPKQHYCLKY